MHAHIQSEYRSDLTTHTRTCARPPFPREPFNIPRRPSCLRIQRRHQQRRSLARAREPCHTPHKRLRNTIPRRTSHSQSRYVDELGLQERLSAFLLRPSTIKGLSACCYFSSRLLTASSRCRIILGNTFTDGPFQSYRQEKPSDPPSSVPLYNPEPFSSFSPAATEASESCSSTTSTRASS